MRFISKSSFFLVAFSNIFAHNIVFNTVQANEIGINKIDFKYAEESKIVSKYKIARELNVNNLFSEIFHSVWIFNLKLSSHSEEMLLFSF